MSDSRFGGSPPISTVIFDYGGVLSLPQPAEAQQALERLAGVASEHFWPAYWDERRDYDRGATATQYWGRIAARVGADWDSARRQDLWTVDVSSWLHVDPDSAALLDRVAATGARLVLLSNAPADLASALRHAPALAPFNALYFSCHLRMCKPEPAIYTHVLEDLGASPEESAFVDDREENVLAAKSLGIDAHRYGGTDALEAFLADRLGAL